MGLVLTAEREPGRRDRDGDVSMRPEGVTLAQLNEVTERATQECLSQGIDPQTVTPTALVRLGGKIKKIEISI